MILFIKYVNVEAKEIRAALPGLVIFINKDGGITTHSGEYELRESEQEYTNRLSKMVAEQKEIY